VKRGRRFVFTLLTAGSTLAAPPVLHGQTAPPAAGGGAADATRDGAPAAQPGSALVPRAGEVRALWVVRTTLTSAQSIHAMIREAEAAGFNTLMVQVRGRGDAFYQSTREPRAESLAGEAPDFDPLALVLEEAHARGMSVHAWVNTFLVWGSGALPLDRGHLVRARPDLLAVPRALTRSLKDVPPQDPRYVNALLRNARANARTVEGLYASPSHPEVQEWVLGVWKELVERYPVDGMHFDYVRYPAGDYDYSVATLGAFRARAMQSLPAERVAALDQAALGEPLAWTRSLPEQWDAFRRDAVTSVVRRVAGEVRALRPGLIVSAAVVPDPAEAARLRFQDWPTWMSEGLLDVVAPMAYTTDNRIFRQQLRAAVEAAGSSRVWAGIGAWQNTFEETLAKIGIAREVGASGLSLFSYDGTVRRRAGRAGASFLMGIGQRAFGG
jgi:uncharacterized lipoprotein YddW (UPF0748 family)